MLLSAYIANSTQDVKAKRVPLLTLLLMMLESEKDLDHSPCYGSLWLK